MDSIDDDDRGFEKEVARLHARGLSQLSVHSYFIFLRDSTFILYIIKSLFFISFSKF